MYINSYFSHDELKYSAVGMFEILDWIEYVGYYSVWSESNPTIQNFKIFKYLFKRMKGLHLRKKMWLSAALLLTMVLTNYSWKTT